MKEHKNIAVGIFVLSVFLVVIFMIFTPSKNSKDLIELNAEFLNADGVSKKSIVTVAGIKVGWVSDIIINPKGLNVTVKMLVDKSIEIPSDSVAQIYGESLFSSKNIDILPGGMLDNLSNGDYFTFVTNSINSERFLNDMLDMAEKQGKKE